MLNRAQKASFVAALRNPAFKQNAETINPHASGPEFLYQHIHTVEKQTCYSVVGVLAALHGCTPKKPNGAWDSEKIQERADALVGASVCAELLHKQLSGMRFPELADYIEKKMVPRD